MALVSVASADSNESDVAKPECGRATALFASQSEAPARPTAGDVDDVVEMR